MTGLIQGNEKYLTISENDDCRFRFVFLKNGVSIPGYGFTWGYWDSKDNIIIEGKI